MESGSKIETELDHVLSKNSFTMCFVKNLSTNINGSGLRDIFYPYGRIVRAKVVLDCEGCSMGFGYVSFSVREEATRARDALHGEMVQGRAIVVKCAMDNCHGYGQRYVAGVNLYVKNLSVDITDERLRNEFAKFGTITNANVSRGFGFVCFSAPDEATRAASEMNGKVVEGKPLYVAHLRTQPQSAIFDPTTNYSTKSTQTNDYRPVIVPKTTNTENDRNCGDVPKYTCTLDLQEQDYEAGRIVIRNLDPSVTVKEINDTFAVFGKITSYRIECYENGASKGFAFVNFATGEDATKAAHVMNGKMIRAKMVNVAKFELRNQRSAVKKDFTNCYVKNLPNDANEAELREMFGQYGDVCNAKVPLDEAGISKGFGIVTFMKRGSALEAVDALHGMVLRDKTIYVCLSSRRVDLIEELSRVVNCGLVIVIKNLCKEMTNDRLRQYFGVSGIIASGRVMIKEDNDDSICCGLLCFSAPDEAARAVSEMNGKVIEGRTLRVALAQLNDAPFAHARTQLQPATFNYDVMNTTSHILRNQTIIMPANTPKTTVTHSNQSQKPQITVINPFEASRCTARPYTFMATSAINEHSKSTSQRDHVADLTEITKSAANVAIEVMAQQNYQREEKNGRHTTTRLTNDSKQIIGDKIYPLVAKQAGNLARKITGMLLELDNAELLYMIENEEALKVKIEGAISVLKVHKKV